MPDTSPAHSGRSRHWLIDAFAGGSLALGLITVADAALPRLERTPPLPSRIAAPAPPPAPAAPAPAPALIAFQAPAPGYPVISPFGLRQLPWEKGGRLHAGVDIAAPAGLPVVAAADGVVTRVATDGGYGRFVELTHAEGLTTVYAHLGRFLPQITPGVAVKAGTPVGALGSTGASTGAHLHFEVRDRKGRPLNPELFLGRRFAEAADLPLRAAARIPRGVRVAYVSNIPTSKREQMQEKLAAELEAEGSTASANAAARPTALAAGAPRSAGEAAKDASTTIPEIRFVNGRPVGRFGFQN